MAYRDPYILDFTAVETETVELGFRYIEIGGNPAIREGHIGTAEIRHGKPEEIAIGTVNTYAAVEYQAGFRKVTFGDEYVSVADFVPVVT